MGKGDRPRPIRDRERYNRNWERIFGDGEGAGQQAIRQGESPTETRQPAPDPDINPAEWEDKQDE